MIQLFTKKRNKKGFTLIELVVVVAILGILAALAIPKLGSTRVTAKLKSEAANARTIASAVTLYQADNDNSAAEPAITDLADYLNDAAGLDAGYDITWADTDGEIASITTPSGTWNPGDETVTP